MIKGVNKEKPVALLKKAKRFARRSRQWLRFSKRRANKAHRKSVSMALKKFDLDFNFPPFLTGQDVC